MSKRMRRRLGLLFLAISAAQAACGPSGDVREIPDDAKKVLVKRKVDAAPRPSGAARTSSRASKGGSAR
jgi:hypothetical protein